MGLTNKDINSLYLTLYNRAPEKEGQQYWLKEANAKGMSIADTANAMLDTQVSKDFFKGKDSSIDFIDHIYKNLLGKDKTVDPEGVAFWASHIDNGMSKGEVVVNMLDAAENQIFAYPAAKKAQQLYHNKLKTAEWTSKVSTGVPVIDKDGNPLPINEQIKGFVAIGQNVTSDMNVLEMIGMVALMSSMNDFQHDFIDNALIHIKNLFPEINQEKAHNVLELGRVGPIDSNKDGVYEVSPEEITSMIKEQAKGAPLLTDVWNSIIGSPQKVTNLFGYENENPDTNSNDTNIKLSGVLTNNTDDGFALVG
ncbi:DUF4214 domain-containing protein [Campylobacter sp. RM15925]|uniref:DUF4214 domain-containing protein n=1 Tax=Campylobacter sp. RM15925 TaxID=1705724 RepID=UPI00147591A9|nr:DUF4214 domain-containing protein [Campylobacter sp. RM15925]